MQSRLQGRIVNESFLRSSQESLPSTAASTSASSNTINGALPPASIESLSNCQGKPRCGDGSTHFFSVPAAYLYSNFATGVLPVNETFLTVGFSHISRPTSARLLSVVTTLITPGGIPARLASCATLVSAVSGGRTYKAYFDERKTCVRRLSWRLDHSCASCRKSSTEFPSNH